MTAYASLSGQRVVGLTLTIPYYGAWTADVTLATDDPIPDACSLTVSNLTLSGHVLRQGPFAGQRAVRVVGGAGGWRKVVAARAYSNPAGLPLSLILNNTAMEIGEKVSIASDTPIGSYYVREAAPASRVLRHLVGRGWWIDPAGVTQVGPRSTPAIRTQFTAAARQGGEGRFSIATEDLAAWQPGATFSGPTVPDTQTVSSVSLSMDAKSGVLRLDVLVGSPDRLASGLSDLIDDETNDTYRGVWEYAVHSARVENAVVIFDGYPTASWVPLPPAVRWPIRPGLAGAYAVPAVGSLVYVAFANADPTRPFVVACDSPTSADSVVIDSSGTTTIGESATEITLGGVGVPLLTGLEIGRPVCYGDKVTIPVSGAAAVGVILQNPLTMPNVISRVKAN